MTVRLIRLADEAIVEEYEVPMAHYFDSRLFTLGSAVYLVTPLGEDDDQTWGIYGLEPGKAPTLVSDTLHKLSGQSEPAQWQNRLTLMGLDDQNRVAMMLIEDGNLRTVVLEEGYPELAGKIGSIYPATPNAAAMSEYRLGLRKVGTPKADLRSKVGRWLQPSGFPPLVEADSEAGYMAKLLPVYYGQNKMLALQEVRRGAMRLGTFSPDDLLDPKGASHQDLEHDVTVGHRLWCYLRHELALLEAPTLYNANLHYLDRTTVLAVGTKTAFRTSELFVFLYDSTTGTLTPLSADLFGSVFADSDSSSIRMWKTGDVLFAVNESPGKDMAGVVVNLADGTSIAVSAALFERIAPPPAAPTSKAPAPGDASHKSSSATDGRGHATDLVVGLGLALAMVVAIVVAIVVHGRRKADAATAYGATVPGPGGPTIHTGTAVEPDDEGPDDEWR